MKIKKKEKEELAQVTVRMPKAFYNRLVKEAKSAGVSINDAILQLLGATK